MRPLAASVPIPKFASLCGTLVCELRNRRTLATYDLVWLWFRSPQFGLAAKMMRTSEPPHYGAAGGPAGWQTGPQGANSCLPGAHALVSARPESSEMTYVVVESCIKCKYMDCVEVCPVDCFYEGENMLVIHPDECIDCGV